MGNVWSTMLDYCPEGIVRSVSDSYTRRREKRKKDSYDNEELQMINSLHSPKRRKLACTAHYIYQALFVEGKDSDITVNILNKDWKLHKVYLGQSQYFNSMFSGSWNETNKSYIRIEVEDPNVTLDALNSVFGSFYQDEITVEPRVVVGVLAASTLFQLEGLIEQCYEIMLETISPVTAVQYYQASCQYGAQNVKAKVIEWFLVNLTDYYHKNPSRLQDIDVELMFVILSHPGLCVVQTELTLYYLLRKWTIARLNILYNNNTENNNESPLRAGEDKEAFLDTNKGSEFVCVFKQLKLKHLLLHVRDLSDITKDRIIPEEWMHEAYKSQWTSLLRILSGTDKGPISIDEAYFNKHSIRCGREICAGDNRSWRWNWFSFGIDLVFSLAGNSILVRRQRTYLDHSASDTSHNIISRINLVQLNEQRQIIRHKKSDLVHLSLTRNQETKLLTYEKDFEFPMFIFLQILLTSPIPEPKPSRRCIVD